MNYQQTLDYLYQQLPMYQRVGAKAFKKDLTNTIQLCEALGNPQQQFPSIHIAGTNGKGSTSHMLAAILQAKGLKVGLYTSPHYRDFRERIKINGTFISEEAVMEWVSQHQPLFERIQPSFFEITVALAFHYFAEAAVDIAVIETGLGGRLDSTNVLSPILSVITNIDYDHMDMLGDTLAQIAGEKAGIIKPNIPVVIGQTHLETRDVFLQKAAQTNSPIHFADQHFAIAPDRIADSRTHYDVYHNGLPLYEDLAVQVLGNYQQYNLATCLQAIELLSDQWAITKADVQTGLADLQQLTTFLGRWQILQEAPLIIAESAHNKAGIRFAMQQLEATPKEQLHFVLGMVKDKDRMKILELLPKHAIYYFAKPAIPRGLDATLLAADAQRADLQGTIHNSVPAALEAAKANAKEADCIYVGGSTFVVAEVI